MTEEYVVEYDVKYMSERLERELTKNRRAYYISWFLLALWIVVLPAGEWTFPGERILFASMGIFWICSIIGHGKVGTSEMVAIAKAMPVSPARECMPLLLRLLPYSMPRRVVMDKIDAMLQQLDK